MNHNPYPILYSLRQCPYCIRARIAMLLANQTVLIREIETKNKPEEMLAVSRKGTVPILNLPDGTIIDESIDIMIWALTQNDPNDLLLQNHKDALDDMTVLIDRTDTQFVNTLNAYKAASRYHDASETENRQQCEGFIGELEHRLAGQRYLMRNEPSLADYAILPFVRQFSRVDRKWYSNAPYPNLQRWLTEHYNNPLYAKTMTKYPKWLDSRKSMLFEP